MTDTDNAPLISLNAVLQHKLTGINQYFLHARMLKHKGLVDMADYTYRSSIDAMKSSDMLVEMVLSMEGIPDMRNMAPVNIGKTPKQMVENDLAHAQSSMQAISHAHTICTQAQLPKAIELLDRIVQSERERIDALRVLLEALSAQTPA